MNYSIQIGEKKTNGKEVKTQKIEIREFEDVDDARNRTVEEIEV